MTVTFDHGAVGTLLFTDAAPSPWSYEFTTGENKKYPHVPGHLRYCYHFLGAQRSVGFPSLHSFSYGLQTEPGWDSPLQLDTFTVETEDPLHLQMRHFAQVCRGLEDPVCSGRDAVESLAVVLAIQKSAECGRPVAPSDMFLEVTQASHEAADLDSSQLPMQKVRESVGQICFGKRGSDVTYVTCIAASISRRRTLCIEHMLIRFYLDIWIIWGTS